MKCSVYIQSPHTGILDSGNEDPNFIDTPETGFLGKLSLIASGKYVEEAVVIRSEGIKKTVRRRPSEPVIRCCMFEEDKNQ